MTKFLNISTDTTLGGSSASDEVVSSQKAIKSYVDNNSPTVDSSLSTTSTNAVQNKVITNALNGKLDGFNLNVAGNWTGGAHAVNFITFDYTDCNSENGIFIKLSMVNSHDNGITGRFFQDVILNCNYKGTVAGTIYRYFAENVDAGMSYSGHRWGDIFWTIDTTNKIVKFYVLMRQYSYTYMTPYFRLNASTKGVISQKSGIGQEEYSSGTQTWTSINWYETDQTYSATSQKPQSGIAIASAGFITSSALSGYQTTSNLVTSVSSSSTNSQYPSAKLFYDTCGDIETLINAL